MWNTKLSPYMKIIKLPEIIDHLYRYYLMLQEVLESEQIKDEATKELIKEDIEFLEIEIISIGLFYKLMANIYKTNNIIY
jgi:hypothetical protein